MDKLDLTMLAYVNANHNRKMAEKEAREMERKEKAKQFTTNLCGSILLVVTCYILYITGCCM